MDKELTDAVRQKCIEGIRKDFEGRNFYISIACAAVYLVFMRSMDAPGGWWIIVWVIVGFLLVGVVANFSELVIARREQQLGKISDEALIKVFRRVSKRTESKKNREQFCFMLFVGFILTLIWKNPEMQQVEDKINEAGRTIFSEGNYRDLHLFSYYFERSDSTVPNILYLNVFDRVLLVLPNKLLDSRNL